MIKKFIFVIFAGLFIMANTGCGDGGSDEPNFDDIPDDIQGVADQIDENQMGFMQC